MDRPSPGWDRWFADKGSRVLVGLMMAWSVALVVVATIHGPGATPDSVNYLAGAESLVRSGEVLMVNGAAMTIFPPGLSILLAVPCALGIEVAIAAIVLNALAAAAGVALTFALARNLRLSVALSLACAAVVATSKATLFVHAYLFSEPIFSVLVLAALVLLVRGCRSRGFSWGQLAAIGAIVSAATAVRFLGLLLIPVVVVAVFGVELTRSSWRRAGLRAGAAGVIASVGLVGVVARNLAQGQPPLGPRSNSVMTPVDVAKQTLNALGDYILAGVFPPAAPAAGFVLACLLAGSAVIVLLRREPGALVVAGFVAVWWVALVYSELTTVIDPIGARLLSPAFGPMVVLVGYGAGALGAKLRGPAGRPAGPLRNRLVAGGGIVVLTTVLVLTSIGSVGFARDAARWGIGFSGVGLRRSEVFAAIAELPPGAGIAMSYPERLYWVSRRRAAAIVPRDDHWYPPERRQRELTALRERIATGDVTHIAFYERDTSALTPADLLAVGLPIEPLEELKDGALYRVTR